MNTDTGEIFNSFDEAFSKVRDKSKLKLLGRKLTDKEKETMQVEPESPCPCGDKKQFSRHCFTGSISRIRARTKNKRKISKASKRRNV